MYCQQSKSLLRDQDNETINDFIIDFILSLYNDPSVTRGTVQMITEKFSQVIENIMNPTGRALKNNLPQQYHQTINDILSKLEIIDEMKTEHSRFEY